jgi:hypothetical protein
MEGIMIELTEPLQKALDEHQGEPLPVVDPRTRETYVLVRADIYARFRELLAPGPLTEEERRVILEGVWKRAGWDDPRMDEYETLVNGGPAC